MWLKALKASNRNSRNDDSLHSLVFFRENQIDVIYAVVSAKLVDARRTATVTRAKAAADVVAGQAAFHGCVRIKLSLGVSPWVEVLVWRTDVRETREAATRSRCVVNIADREGPSGFKTHDSANAPPTSTV